MATARPNCGENIGWLQRWRFSGFFRWRKIRPCPHCGVNLRWSAAVYVPGFAAWGAILVYLYILLAKPQNVVPATLLVLLFFLAAVCGAITSKFQLAPGGEQAVAK